MQSGASEPLGANQEIYNLSLTLHSWTGYPQYASTAIVLVQETIGSLLEPVPWADTMSGTANTTMSKIDIVPPIMVTLT